MGEEYNNRGKIIEKDYFQLARKAVSGNKALTSEEKAWLYSILNILKDGDYVRVLADNCLIDIMDVANTPSYAASFFDVYNNIYRYKTSCPPFRIQKIVNDYHKLYSRTESDELW